MMMWFMQDLFARLVVLLHNPLARGQLATQILTVCLLTDLECQFQWMIFSTVFGHVSFSPGGLSFHSFCNYLALLAFTNVIFHTGDIILVEKTQKRYSQKL